MAKIRADQLLVSRGLADSRTRAQALIMAGAVFSGERKLAKSGDMLAEDAPTRTIMGAGAGSFALIRILETEGINLAEADWTPDAIAAHFSEIGDMSTAKALEGAFQQTQKYVAQAAARAGVKL